jgi:very-short-patch-repair endonuclease
MLLQQYGFTRKRLADDVRTGELVRIRPGVFATPTTDAGVIAAAEHGGALTCARALSLHGVWTLDHSAAVHVWLGGNGRAHHQDCSCVSHFFEGRAGLGLTPLEDVLVHVHQCAGDEAFFAALESALEQRKINRSAKGRIRRRLPKRGHWLVDLARADAASGLESLLRLRLHLCGIRLDCQVDIPTVGRVDFVIDDRLILEADGKDNHHGESNRHKDRVRDAAASALGYETLRFDYAQIVHGWPSVEAAVIAAVTRLQERV